MLKDTKGKSESSMREVSMKKIRQIITFEDQFKRNIENGSYKDKYLSSINDISISQWDAHYKNKT